MMIMERGLNFLYKKPYDYGVFDVAVEHLFDPSGEVTLLRNRPPRSETRRCPMIWPEQHSRLWHTRPPG